VEAETGVDWRLFETFGESAIGTGTRGCDFQERGLKPGSYLHSTLLVNVTDAVTNEFLRERVGVARLNEILATQGARGALAGAVFSGFAAGRVCGKC